MVWLSIVVSCHLFRAMARRWRIEAVQQKTSLDVQMSQRIGPRIQNSVIWEKNKVSPSSVVSRLSHISHLMLKNKKKCFMLDLYQLYLVTKNGHFCYRNPKWRNKEWDDKLRNKLINNLVQCTKGHYKNCHKQIGESWNLRNTYRIP